MTEIGVIGAAVSPAANFRAKVRVARLRALERTFANPLNVSRSPRRYRLTGEPMLAIDFNAFRIYALCIKVDEGGLV